MNSQLGPYEQRIAAFYNAFRELDARAMTAAYASDARFRDPLFDLHGRDEIGAMWAMLCEAVQARGRDVWQLDVDAIQADQSRGRARWEARYRYGARGRAVHNVIDAEFAFDAHGLIKAHRDAFDFWRWSRQALGPLGWALGWTPWLHARVAARARAALDRRLR